MKYQKEADHINKLISVSEILLDTPLDGQPFKRLGFTNDNISFVGFDNLKIYEETIEHLFRSNKEISESYTMNKFQDEIINLIKKLKKEKKECTPNDFEDVILKFLKMEIQDYEILYNFYGATMQAAFIQFGDFTIYDRKKSFEALATKYKHPNFKEVYSINLDSDLLIGVKIKTRDNTKAIEIADDLCRSFENVFSYAVADLTHKRRIGILNFRDWTTISKIICGENSTISSEAKNDVFLEIDIESPFFNDKSQGNNKIWDLITKKNKSEIEERLLNAIEWIGKASYDKDIQKSLVQFVFAIEGMLQFNEKAFITPSIVSQLGDWLAFIINDEKEKRKEISKYFKDIYQKRSAIAHGAKKNIDMEDLKMAKQIAKLMVIAFLTQKPFNEMTSMEQLSNYMTDLKFK